MIKVGRTYFIFFLSFICFSSFSQLNLVLNPSFETYTACPGTSDELNKATGWSSFAYTPDYFNSCAPYSSVFPSVPLNFSGYQLASNGNAYSGFTSYVSETQVGIPNYREYLGGTLNSTLLIGTKYYVSFKVNLTLDYSIKINCASDKIGVKFSKTKYSAGSPPPPNNSAKVFTNSIIIDTLNWIRIFGSFVSDSAYNYVIIGNFFNDTNTDTLIMDSSPTCKFSYYYVDDICVSTDSIYASNYSTGINETPGQNSIVYPNPVIDFVFINGINQFREFKLFDLMGKEVKLEILKDRLDLTNVAPGIYFLFCKRDDEIYKSKIIKK